MTLETAPHEVAVLHYDKKEHVSNPGQKDTVHCTGAWKFLKGKESRNAINDVLFRFHSANWEQTLNHPQYQNLFVQNDYIDSETGETMPALEERVGNTVTRRYMTDGKASNTGPLNVCCVELTENKVSMYKTVSEKGVVSMPNHDDKKCYELQLEIFGEASRDMLTFVGGKICLAAPKHEKK